MRTYPSIVFLILIASLFILPSTGFCQASPKPTCAVLPFYPDEGSAQDYESRYITNRYADLLRELDRYNIISPAELEKRLIQIELLKNCSAKQCATEIGKALNANFVIYGIIGHIGNLYSLDTTIVNVDSGKILNSKVTDFEGTRDEFVEKAPAANITSLLMLSQMPAEWRTTSDKVVQPPRVEATETEPVEEIAEPAEEMEKPFHVGPRLGLGYSDDGVEVGIGFEARHNNLSVKVIGGPIGIAGSFSYYFQPVGNTPYASLVVGYYEDDPHGIDEEGMIYGILGGYRLNLKENIDLSVGIGVGYVDWEQTELNNAPAPFKDDGTDLIPIGEFTIGYMF